MFTTSADRSVDHQLVGQIVDHDRDVEAALDRGRAVRHAPQHERDQHGQQQVAQLEARSGHGAR